MILTIRSRGLEENLTGQRCAGKIGAQSSVIRACQPQYNNVIRKANSGPHLSCSATLARCSASWLSRSKAVALSSASSRAAIALARSSRSPNDRLSSSVLCADTSCTWNAHAILFRDSIYSCSPGEYTKGACDTRRGRAEGHVHSDSTIELLRERPRSLDLRANICNAITASPLLKGCCENYSASSAPCLRTAFSFRWPMINIMTVFRSSNRRLS